MIFSSHLLLFEKNMCLNSLSILGKLLRDMIYKILFVN